MVDPKDGDFKGIVKEIVISKIAILRGFLRGYLLQRLHFQGHS